MLWYLVNVGIVLTTIFGLVLIAHKNKIAFISLSIVDLCMIIIGINTSQYGLIVTGLIYIGGNVYSYKCWWNDEIQQSSKAKS